MKVWNKLSLNARYYIISFLNLGVWWGLLAIAKVDFVNLIFFLTAFVWHFALLTPGLKEQVLTNHHKLSFLAIVVRANHYLQMFINIKRIPYSSSLVRAISPALFTFLLFVVGGTGNILFTFLGSICFEVTYIVIKSKTTQFETSLLERKDDLSTGPVIPSVEKSHE